MHPAPPRVPVCGLSSPTIHCTPKRSLHMPKHGDPKVGPSGMKTLPPSASAS
jgi:hypothetical protein